MKLALSIAATTKTKHGLLGPTAMDSVSLLILVLVDTPAAAALSRYIYH